MIACFFFSSGIRDYGKLQFVELWAWPLPPYAPPKKQIEFSRWKTWWELCTINTDIQESNKQFFFLVKKNNDS